MQQSRQMLRRTATTQPTTQSFVQVCAGQLQNPLPTLYKTCKGMQPKSFKIVLRREIIKTILDFKPWWRNWQTRRSQKPVRIKPRVGSIPTLGTKKFAIKFFSVNTGQSLALALKNLRSNFSV